MNAKAAKRIRYAVRCMGLKTAKPEGSFLHILAKHPVLSHMISISAGQAETSSAKKMITQFKRQYKALPFHRREVHQESHSFVLQVKHGNATRRFPAN